MAAGKTDSRGWSLADCLSRVDEGSAGGPAIPAGVGGNAARTAQRVRLKESYALVAKHELDVDHRSHMAQNHFQNGPDAWDYLLGIMREPTTALQLRWSEPSPSLLSHSFLYLDARFHTHHGT